jgi:hypothetical protein
MPRRRLHLAIGASAIIHGAMAFVFWRMPNPDAPSVVELPLEIEIIVPEIVARSPSVVPSGSGVAIAKPAMASPSTESRGQPHREDIVPNNVPSAMAEENGSKDFEPTADRLWSLRNGSSIPGVNPTDIGASDPQWHPGSKEVTRDAPPSAASRNVKGRGGVDMHLDEDGTIREFSDPPAELKAYVGEGVVGIGGKFDLTDKIMKAVGQNPYRYEQHRLAEATREERLCKMIEAQRSREKSALFGLKERLSDIMMTPGYSDSEKRRTLFELWDECLDQDPATHSGASAMRATIEAFVRDRLPLHSGRGYLAAELTLLNKKRSSRAVFDPYRVSIPDAGVLP